MKKATVRDYVGSQRRYAHLDDAGIGQMEEYVADLNAMIVKLETGFSG